MELLSRKEAREKLGLSDATFRRRLKELNIKCVSEDLPNGVQSKKITYTDFLRLAKYCDNNKETEKPNYGNNNELINLKYEIVRLQTDYSNILNLANEKDRIIEILLEDKKALQEEKRKLEEQKYRAEEKNEKIFDELIKLSNSKKSLLSKIFSKK